MPPIPVKPYGSEGPAAPPAPLPVNLEFNREGWLTEVARASEVFFKGFKLPQYRVTCGWPCRFALGRKRRVVGECHGAKSSKGGVFELFISPLLDDPPEVAGTLLHEIAHVAAGIEAGHKGQFVKVCRHVELVKGKPIVAMPGDRLAASLLKITDRMGPYPHVSMAPAMKLVTKPNPDVTMVCVNCGCRVRMTFKWAVEAGAPTCGCGGKMGLEFAEDG